MADANLTKREFARVMKDLMESNAFGKISIGDICQASKLSRKTFYYHFQDKYELVNWIFFTEFVQVVQANDYTDEWSLMRDLCVYLYDNRLFYVHAFAIQGQDAFRDYFGSFLTPQLLEMMGESFSNPLYRDLYVSFYTEALTMAIARWLESNQMNADEFMEFIRESLQNAANFVVRRAGQLPPRDD